MFDETLYKKVGEKLKIKRIQLQKSQEEIEYKAGLGEKHLGKIERAEIIPLYPTFYKVCQTLGINTQTIVDEAKEELRASKKED
ncbi:helix-turn-helix domain-containing protein [Oceanobacillus alkalisoli]|uniref:helix-turn-helix domain-containing protein n=1 Tax=Oceanobacillus alkalisoli TaxID=2925113 RepID=UPI001EEFDBB1|nr:helix-turn-helix transcriptional regulator [Oceanobacillus alkalisoli]MCF3942607.1 helix-turn-helix domain-containing protein [Oceanobacillus alkalisoli]MCG5102583.1 helix-turn-helix domain-containing protein [Oceanobacillus alkalisoli]